MSLTAWIQFDAPFPRSFPSSRMYWILPLLSFSAWATAISHRSFLIGYGPHIETRAFIVAAHLIESSIDKFFPSTGSRRSGSICKLAGIQLMDVVAMLAVFVSPETFANRA